MPVSRIALTDFRSYASATVEPGPDFILLFGENGAGKTNLLEAVSLLAPGRGLRGAPLAEMARASGGGGFAVAVRLGDIDLGTGTQAAAPERRQVRVNGAPASVNSLSEWLSVLWLTPAMDRLFTGSAGDRRRFLDRLVLALELGHAHHSTRYDAAMRARNKLLADERLAGSQISRFLVLHKELDADDGELTRTRKVRRGFISERYRTLVDALYGGEAHRFVETEVTFEDGRKGRIAADLKILDAKTFPIARRAA